MKGRSSHKIQREFPQIKKRYWGRRFWGRGYFSTTNGAITEDIVLRYLEQHIANPTDASRYWLSRGAFFLYLIRECYRASAIVEMLAKFNSFVPDLLLCLMTCGFLYRIFHPSQIEPFWCRNCKGFFLPLSRPTHLVFDLFSEERINNIAPRHLRNHILGGASGPKLHLTPALIVPDGIPLLNLDSATADFQGANTH